MRQFARLFQRGGVFAYPTESVYGLGCDPSDREAVERLLQIKQRAPEKGLILIASAPQQLEPWVNLKQRRDWKKLTAEVPRPTTWLVPAAAEAPWWITGLHQRIAVRMTRFPPAVQLCDVAGSALVSTSANQAGRAALRSQTAVEKILGNQLDTILGGATGGVSQPSEIRDLYSGEVVRAG